MPQIKISYIIITWNGIDHIRNLFRSLQNQISRQDVEIIVVDNGSNDGTTDFLRTSYPSARLITLNNNKGVAYARNRGLEKALGQYLFILDNDIIANDEALTGMEKYMDTNINVGLCGCKLYDAEGNLQESCKPYPGISQKIYNLFHRGKFRFHYKDMPADQPFEPEYIIGACQMIRREAFEQTGLLDENIFYGPEDCDYCLRIRKAGWKVIYLPQYSLIHHCQRKTNIHPFSPLARKHIRGLMYLYMKYKRI